MNNEIEVKPSSPLFPRLTIEATCTGCGRCVAVCPHHALSLTTERTDGFGRKTVTVNQCCCVNCGDCLAACLRHDLRIIRK